MTRIMIRGWATLLLIGLLALPGAAYQKLKLTIGLPGSAALASETILETFVKENPDLSVEPLSMGWSDFFSKIAVMLASGTAPDVWYGEAGRALGWRFNKATADLTPFVERDLDTSQFFFLHAARDPRTGEWTGIPSDFQVTALFYNINHFADRALPFPDDTWSTDTLVETAKKLTIIKSGACPERYGFNLQPSYITTSWMLWPRLFGAPILNAERTRSMLTDPTTVASFDYMRSLMHDIQIAPAPGGGCSGYAFAGGGFSMEFNVYSHILALAAKGMEAYDVTLIPKSPTGKQFTTAVPNVWVINAASAPDVQEAAWKWIKHQISEEAQLIRMATGAGVLVNRRVGPSFLRAPGPPQHREVFLQSYSFADTLEENAVWSEYRNALGAELNQLWSGRVSAQTATLNAHRKVQAILTKTYP